MGAPGWKRFFVAVCIGTTWIAPLAAALSAPPKGDVIVVVDQSQARGGRIVLADVDLTKAAEWCGVPGGAGTIRAVTVREGAPVMAQFIPAPWPETSVGSTMAGILALKLPDGSDGRIKLHWDAATPGAGLPPWDGRVRLPGATVTHDLAKRSGFPSKITFADGKSVEGFKWNDRLFEKDRGWFGIASDPGAVVERLAEGPIGTAVRSRGRYLDPQGDPPPSQPEAVYDWLYIRGEPLVWVHATVRQREIIPWKEIHFLEFNYPNELFPAWAGGEPLQDGRFSGSKRAFPAGEWGLVMDGARGLGMFDCGNARFYDGGGGTYLHAHGDAAWQGWDGARRDFSAWLWIGSDSNPAAAMTAAAKRAPRLMPVRVTVEPVHHQIEQVRGQLTDASARQALWWRPAMAERLEDAGRFDDALGVLSGRMPSDARHFSGGDLGCILRVDGKGAEVQDLFDIRLGTSVLARRMVPLFDITLRHLPSGKEKHLTAETSWGECCIGAPGNDGFSEISWRRYDDTRLGELSVVARFANDPSGAMRWTMRVKDVPADWSVLRVRFPQLAVRERGRRPLVLFPRGSGEVQVAAGRRGFRFDGTYPSGWTAMQFLASYDGDDERGLYVGIHDPLASTKDIALHGLPGDDAVSMAFEHPAAQMGVGGNGFELPGVAVWQIFEGDWFDAAMIYRDWVRREARWYPKSSPEGRADTPMWMRELSAWAMTGGKPAECVAQVKDFAAFLGLPVGFHWYNWHGIPFDNDYPHYFPAKDGFSNAVRELEAAGVHVMPYINGRLWDTRDRGVDDFEFSKIARAAASKDETGKPYEESYSSKESDGSPVRLAAMCPQTALWRKTVNGTVLRLFDECGVGGVYIDQVAAAKPTLCSDRSHGHPLGGGHWWMEGYWQMLEALRTAKPADRILTTECNAEPYAHVFDGYLTWHWQYDGQVPVFPAIYGGAIQMFGRAYRGGPTKDLALRMKAGQQLVFGEQIGWLSPSVIKEQENARFLRSVVRLRHGLRKYFYAGEMARPPVIEGEMPRVTADWQWHGTWPVTTDAIMAGAWWLPLEEKLVIIFVNVKDEPLVRIVNFDAGRHGMRQLPMALTEIANDDRAAPIAVNASFRREIALPPRGAKAWEFTPRQGKPPVEDDRR